MGKPPLQVDATHGKVHRLEAQMPYEGNDDFFLNLQYHLCINNIE